MKKKISMIAISLLLIVLAVTFMGCKKNEIDEGLYPFDVPEITVSGSVPAEVPADITPINSKMSAEEMLKTAVDNYYKMNYVAINQHGQVDTAIGPIAVTQLVNSIKIREGAANASDVQYFADNKSYSQFVSVWEETIIDKGTIKIRNMNNDAQKGKIYDRKKETWNTPTAFNAPETYTDLAALVADKKNDPTKIWMYDIDTAGAISKTDEPEYDEVTDSYRFNVLTDVSISAVKYREVMEYMLSTSGMPADKVDFKALKIRPVIYSNGLFRTVLVEEGYHMEIAGFLDASVVLYSTLEFVYERSDAPSQFVKDGFEIKDYMKKF